VHIDRGSLGVRAKCGSSVHPWSELREGMVEVRLHINRLFVMKRGEVPLTAP
jgi:hypothetical protein